MVAIEQYVLVFSSQAGILWYDKLAQRMLNNSGQNEMKQPSSVATIYPLNEEFMKTDFNPTDEEEKSTHL